MRFCIWSRKKNVKVVENSKSEISFFLVSYHTMMRNFRIIKTKLAEEYTYGVAEVYYNEEDENKPAMHTDYIDGLFASEEELLEHFKMIVEDIERCIQHKGTLIAREEDRE